MTDAIQLEKKLAAMSPGQRVTLDDVNGAIISEHYFTASQGVQGATDLLSDEVVPALGLLTFCVLVLWNGYTVTGQSACADPSNYNQEIGEKIARDNAVKQIWPLIGYDLRCKITRDERLVAGALVEPREGYGRFIGTKVVNAIPCMRVTYCQLRGWEVPADENPEDDGYLIEYTDRIENMHPDYQGYISWSPKEVFERAYRAVRPAAPQAREGNSKGDETASVEAKPESFLDRLKIEHEELDIKLKKLQVFIDNHIFLTLPAKDRSDLQEQASFMFGYLMILERRLARLA